LRGHRKVAYYQPTLVIEVGAHCNELWDGKKVANTSAIRSQASVKMDEGSTTTPSILQPMAMEKGARMGSKGFLPLEDIV
jgi:hypothetical protein